MDVLFGELGTEMTLIEVIDLLNSMEQINPGYTGSWQWSMA